MWPCSPGQTSFMRLVLNLVPTTARTSGFLLWGLLFFHRGCPSEGPVLELHFSSHSECKGISLDCRLSADDSQISNSSLKLFPRFQAQPSNCLLHISPWMSLRCLELNVLITDFFFTPLSKSHFQVLFSSCHVYLQWKSPQLPQPGHKPGWHSGVPPLLLRASKQLLGSISSTSVTPMYLSISLLPID